MAEFQDVKGGLWQVDLDAPLIEEIREKHQIDLVDLEKDPLVTLRSSPLKIVAVAYLICREQIESQGVTPDEFGRLLKKLDPVLEAIREAIIGFFPSGRASHVREVLTKHEEMAAQADQLAVEQMQSVLADPRTKRRMHGLASKELEAKMEALFPLDS